MTDLKSPNDSDERIKFLVIASEHPEARLSAFFAGRRARRSNARVVLLTIIEPPEFGHWATVAETMRAEANEKAEDLLREFAAEVKAQSGDDPEEIIREGVMVEEIRKLIEEDPLISILFLGASAETKGPGPLVAALAKNPAYLSARPIPVTVVPGAMTRDELRRLAG
ncbi:universal stress protein [Hyphococcus sp.]|uniref:universal stress protein n=1 Tax=Hyphococcus sp. TaxID=2038636 RepID=UPI002084EBF5|nr:MAG: universal stress protein A [Marinicaulis sp.]